MSTTRRCGSEGQCSCDSTRSALALESQVVSRRREAAAAAVGSSHRAARCLPSVSIVAAVHARRTQFSRAQREGMPEERSPPPPQPHSTHALASGGCSPLSHNCARLIVCCTYQNDKQLFCPLYACPVIYAYLWVAVTASVSVNAKVTVSYMKSAR